MRAICSRLDFASLSRTVYRYPILLLVALGAVHASAFESTAVLPKGKRNLQLKFVDTHLRDKSDDGGETVPLSEPLSKELTFARALRGEKSLIKRSMLESAMLLGEFGTDDSLGRFSADLRGHVQVSAPIIAYGLTERLTLAVAIPYYRTATDIEVGFKESATAKAFLASLHEDDRRQFGAAQTAFAKIDGAVFELNKKLRDNGYQELGPWQEEGFGDLTLAAKYLARDEKFHKLSVTAGLVAPTGRVDDPNILTDIGFGDGTWDLAGTLTNDLPFGEEWVWNQYAKYAYQFSAQRDIRLVTEEEPIEGEIERTNYKLGDKINTGTSMNYVPGFGLLVGLAYEYYHKYGDKYQVKDSWVADKYAKDTFQLSHRGELLLGYSSVPAFRRGETPVPFKANLFYSRHLRSLSMPNNDLLGFDASVFF